MLETGTWKSGARFATEREIEERFAVSRTVVRPALDLLVGDGAIVRVRGSGTFVAPPRCEIEIFGLIRALTDPPQGVGLTVVSAQERSPDHAVTHFLQLKSSTPIGHVTAVMHIDDQPTALFDSYVPVSLLPWLLPMAHALKNGAELPDRAEIDIGRARVWVEHTFFGPWGGPLVGVRAGDPALMARFVQFGRTAGRKREGPLEFARLIYRTDNAQLHIELDSPGPLSSAR